MAEASVEVDADPLEPREAGLSDGEEIGNATGEDMSLLHAQPQSSAKRTSVVHHQQQQQQPPPGRDRSADDNRVELPTTPLPPYYHFNTLLLEISEEITSSVLEKIKFLYKDEIKSKLVEKIGNARELFKVLEQRRYIMPESLIHLQKCVMMIDDQQTRVSLMERIFKYSQEHKAVYFRRSTDEPPNGYRRYQCHIKGVEHYKFNTDSVRILLYTVASLTGIDQSEILVDEIQMTNSVYITFLVKEVHYTMFHALLKKGLPLLSELNVDLVTFLDAENGETIDVSSGRTIHSTLPPVQESPEQTIQRLSDAIEKVQLQNIDQKREIEQLSATVELLSAEVQMDSKTLSENVQEAMHDAYEEGVSKPSVLRVISLNTKLVKNIEKKRSSAMESKLRAEIQCLEAELDECNVKVKLLQENLFSEDEPVDVNTKRKLENVNKDPHTENSQHITDAAGDNAEQDVLESLQVALNKAQDLGYAKEVIDQIVSRNTAYIKHKCTMQWHTDKQLLLRNNRLLQGKVAATNSLLQKAKVESKLKQDFILQLETIFRSDEQKQSKEKQLCGQSEKKTPMTPHVDKEE